MSVSTALEMRKKEDCKFQASLDYVVRPYLKKKKTKKPKTTTTTKETEKKIKKKRKIEYVL
jgi:hypothetical protein